MFRNVQQISASPFSYLSKKKQKNNNADLHLWTWKNSYDKETESVNGSRSFTSGVWTRADLVKPVGRPGNLEDLSFLRRRPGLRRLVTRSPCVEERFCSRCRRLNAPCYEPQPEEVGLRWNSTQKTGRGVAGSFKITSVFLLEQNPRWIDPACDALHGKLHLCLCLLFIWVYFLTISAASIRS